MHYLKEKYFLKSLLNKLTKRGPGLYKSQNTLHSSPCSSMGPLPWGTVLHELLQHESFLWAAVLYELSQCGSLPQGAVLQEQAVPACFMFLCYKLHEKGGRRKRNLAIFSVALLQTDSFDSRRADEKRRRKKAQIPFHVPAII